MAIKKNAGFRVPVKFSEKLSEPLTLRAYLFSRKKRFIETTIVKNDEAVFKTAVKRKSDVVMLIVPNNKKISSIKNYYALMYRHKAYRPVIRLDLNRNFEILDIPDRFLPFWYMRKCRVTGNVSKFFDISGVTEKKGLCKMKVHICEVDKIHWLLPTIPDDIIIRIPDLILNPELPMPVPVPDPLPPIRPFPNPIPFPDPIFTPILRNIKPKRSNISTVFSGSSMLNIPKIKAIDKEFMLTDSIKPISSNEGIVRMLKTKNPKLIRNTILNNFHLFHPIFCYVPWLWHYFYKCDELDVVYTDDNGDFDTDIWYSLFGDHPDLYFWVESFIDDEWKTVYKPSLPCHTYWNYPCGTDVNINITDPRVYWDCAEDIAGKIVWIKTVGHGTSVSHIEQNDVTGALIQNKILKRQGLTDKHEGVGNYRRPFGSGLYFMMQFSNELPSNKYTYYRWSYEKIKNADMSNAVEVVKPISNPVHKNYSYIFKGSDNHFHFAHNKVKLGPFPKGSETGLYLIPTDSPKDSPFSAPELEADWSRNTKSISFDSKLDGNGLYEFTLELFDFEGNKVTDIPNELFQMPKYNSTLESVDAPSINLVGSSAGKCSAFKMVMRIDNSKCEADIYKIKVDGKLASPNCCGFVPYANKNTSEIEVTFRAYHPQNFADFNFTVKKGTCRDSTQTNKTNVRHKMVLGNANTNSGVSYVRNGVSVYSKTFSPADLLGVCATGGKAAFAEYLHVDALATNGNHIINAFDAPALAAFALEPKS